MSEAVPCIVRAAGVDWLVVKRADEECKEPLLGHCAIRIDRIARLEDFEWYRDGSNYEMVLKGAHVRDFRGNAVYVTHSVLELLALLRSCEEESR